MIKSISIANYLNESITIELERPEQSGFIVKNITGLGPDKATINISEIVSQDGGIFNSARKPTRNIVMDLQFAYDPQLKDVGLYSIEDCRHRSYQYFPLKRKITLTILTDTRELEIDGIVESNEPDIFSKEEGCQISILCPNPYFREKRNQITQESGSVKAFEFPFSNELVALTLSQYVLDYGYMPNNCNLYLDFVLESRLINEFPSSFGLYVMSNKNTSQPVEKLMELDIMTSGESHFSDILITNFYIPYSKYYSGEYYLEFKTESDNRENEIFLKNITIILNYINEEKEDIVLKQYDDIKLTGTKKYQFIFVGNIGNSLLDERLPNQIITDENIIYNLQISKGIEFGYVHHYVFPTKIFYKGTIDTGFVMTIEFNHSLVDDPHGSTENSAGYLVIRNPRYYNKKLVIDLDKIKETLPRCTIADDGFDEHLLWWKIVPPVLDKYKDKVSTVVPVAQKGDIITIDTRTGHKGVYYQKPDWFINDEYIDQYGDDVFSLWVDSDELGDDPTFGKPANQIDSYKNKKLNILSAINKDREWFQIGPGYNELQIYHTFYPESIEMKDEEKDLVHANYLEVQVENEVLYEGV